MEPRRLVLFSGMGGDGRLFGPIRVQNVDLVKPDHIEPQPEEGLAQYAERVAKIHDIGETDVIGGASFGGMVAAQIASARSVAGLVLLGSSLQPRRLPWSYWWIERFGRFVPDGFLRVRSWPPLVRWRFFPVTPEAEACLIAMAASCQISRIRAFGRMALRWSGVIHASCPKLSIHGDLDRIIPIGCTETDVVFARAGHAFTLTHGPETSAAIQDFVARL